ncbi:GGDEF domain-containing protein [Myxococcota bacterium]|nr:GGDEF domain-containing protein [Myxococcota bacterium]
MKHIQEALNKLYQTAQKTLELVYQDDKTPLQNNLAFQDALTNIGRNPQHPDVLVCGDLNGFKSINDQFGHDAGDAVIAQAGRILQTLFVDGLHIRAFHISGDEFALLLPKQQLQAFIQQAQVFAKAPARHEKETILFGMSFGYASTDHGTQIPSPPELKSRAEIALQIAKQQGAGCCVGWSEELSAQKLETLRQRCPTCNTTTSCSVPADRLPTNKQLKSCPICEQPFS